MLKTNTTALFVIISIWFAPAAFGQVHNQKQIDINLGAGIAPTFCCADELPKFSANFTVNYKLTPQFRLGAYYTRMTAERIYYDGRLISANYVQTWMTWDERQRWVMNIFGIRGAYHFNNLNKNNRIDLYSGFIAGYDFVNYIFDSSHLNAVPGEWINEDEYSSDFVWSVFAGCSYNFVKSMGVFAEVGYGITYVNLGLNFKIIEKE